MTRRRPVLVEFISWLLMVFLLGVGAGVWASSRPTPPSDWSCETTHQLKAGYKLCRIKEGKS